MKGKLLKVSLLSCLSILLLSSISAVKVESFSETTMDAYSNAERVDVRKVSIGDQDEVKHSKTFVQIAKKDDVSYLRFATAISGPIKSAYYTRKGIEGIKDGLDQVKNIEFVYSGIKAGENVLYYDGEGTTATKPEIVSYYWACYTFSFSGTEYLDTAWTVALTLEDENGVITNVEERVSSYNDAKSYTLTLNNATVVSANGKEVAGVQDGETTTYNFVKGTEVTIRANEDPEGKMFVGFDKDAIDNRVGQEGVREYTFVTGKEDTSITAVYNTLEYVLPGIQDGSKFDGHGLTDAAAEKITESTDPDLEGLKGYSITLPDNHAGKVDYSKETMAKSNLLTSTDFADKTVKVIVKNHSDYDVYVDVYFSYFGNGDETGKFLVPAHGTAKKFMHAYIGLNSCAWGIAVAEDIGGDGTGTVKLDLVAGAAKTLQKSRSLALAYTENSDDYMQFGETSDSPRVKDGSAGLVNTGASNGYGIGGNGWYSDKCGAWVYAGNLKTGTSSGTGASTGLRIDNWPDQTFKEKVTVYVKITNTTTFANPTNTLYICVAGHTRQVVPLLNKPTARIIASHKVEFTESHQSVVFAMEVDPSISGSTNLHMNFAKLTADIENEKALGVKKTTFIAQFAYTNIFGELTA